MIFVAKTSSITSSCHALRPQHSPPPLTPPPPPPKIPKLTSSTGHRADSWSLDKPALTGKFTLSHYETSNILHISLLEPSGSLFARCPINLNGTPPKLLDTVVETVLDSSRYFVLLCVDDATKREVRVGIGFRDRTHASDLKGHLQDYVRSIERQNKAKEVSPAGGANATRDVNT